MPKGPCVFSLSVVVLPKCEEVGVLFSERERANERETGYHRQPGLRSPLIKMACQPILIEKPRPVHRP